MSTIPVLVIEDNLIDLVVASKMLSHLGCSVETAQDPLVGVQLARQSQFLIVFIDWKMEPIDGGEVIRQIREEGASNQAVLVIISSSDDPHLGRRAGAAYHVVKPLTISGMREILARTVPGY